MVVTLILVGTTVAGALAWLAWTVGRRPAAAGTTDVAVLAARLEGVPQALIATREQLVALSERVGAVEAGASAMRAGLGTLQANLAQTGTVASGIREATETIRHEIARAQEGLGKLEASSRARQELEDRTAQSIRRLEAVIAGTAAKGTAGENMCEVVFAQLPPEWQERDFRVGNLTVEFGLRLPNGLVVPIDSKWPATGVLERLIACEDVDEQQRLKRQLEQAVLVKVREVQKYLDPSLTAGYGVAVVPDAVYELSGGVLGEAMRLDVMLIGQSMFVPCLLLVVQAAMRDSRNVDVERLAGYLRSADQGLAALSKEIEGRLSNAIVMLGNSRDALRAGTARVSGGLAALGAPVDALAPVPSADCTGDGGGL